MNILTNIDLNKNQILNGTFQRLAIAPSSPVQGQFYFNTTSNSLQIYNGTVWVDVGVPTGDLPDLVIDNIEGLRAALDGKVDDSQVLTDVPAGAVFTDTIVDVIDLGLDRVDNTADIDKPISTATQAALDAKESVTSVNTKIAGVKAQAKEYTDLQITELIGEAPEVLDTLHEIAEALGNDPEFATTIIRELGLKTGKAKLTIGDGVATEYVITHGLNTEDVITQIRQAGLPGEIVYTNIEITNENTITVRFAEAPQVDEYIVTIIG